MITELSNYEVSPRIVPIGRESTVRIRPLGSHAAFRADAMYSIQFLPMQDSREFAAPRFGYDVVQARPEAGGDLVFSYLFEAEQAYYVRLFRPEDINETTDDLREKYSPSRAWKTFHVYALEEDLYALRPYRGDFHAHSTASDGSEAPAFVAANYRKRGFDFFSLTDHHHYHPSVEAQDAFRAAPIDLLIANGEEVHSPGNSVHIVNFGGRSSVNKLFRDDPDTYEREVRDIMARETGNLPAGVDAYSYAACMWVFRKIRAAGGMAIFAHPHWLADVFHIPQKLTDALFASGEFDAFELLGGHTQFENNIQTAFYNDLLARGGRGCGIVGSSDEHCTEPGNNNSYWFTWLSTIVFAKPPEAGAAPANGCVAADAVMDAVKNRLSVAVETYPNEEDRVYGSLRLVLYAKFLLKYYFPIHDELCFEEGRLMKGWLLGEKNAEAALALTQGRVGRLLDLYWGQA